MGRVRLPNKIESTTGLEFDYFAPIVTLEDVARGLSKECRFARQIDPPKFLSVAEHSVLVANLVATRTNHRQLALAALWHDAHEAYMGDLATPLKKIIGPKWGEIADLIDEDVERYLALPDGISLEHPVIHWADETAMLYEASQVKHGPGWEFTREMDHPEADAAVKEMSAPYAPSIGRTPSAAYRLFVGMHWLLKDHS